MPIHVFGWLRLPCNRFCRNAACSLLWHCCRHYPTCCRKDKYIADCRHRASCIDSFKSSLSLQDITILSSFSIPSKGCTMSEYFSLSECDVIGFDLDHTLCRYYLKETSRVSRTGIMYIMTQSTLNKAYSARTLTHCYNKSEVYDLFCLLYITGTEAKQSCVDALM